MEDRAPLQPPAGQLLLGQLRHEDPDRLIDGAYAGTTPFTLSDSKIVGSTTQIRLEYPGLAPTTVAVSRNEELKVGTLIVGIFLLVPLLWVMGYQDEHTYDLAPQPPMAAR